MRSNLRAFSLVELIIVVVIIGVLASMALPRLSRGAEGASEAATEADLAMLRSAILRYAAEHGNRFPGPTGADVERQLTQYTNLLGEPSPTQTSEFRFGPYLVRIPPLPTGQNKGSATIGIDPINSPPQKSPTSTAGWIYNPNTGEIVPNDGIGVQTGGMGGGMGAP